MESRKQSIGAVIAVVVVVLGLAGLAISGRPDGNLSDAVANGRHAQVQILLGQAVDVDEPVVGGFTPLMRAAVRDDAAMVRLLIDGGADLDAVSANGGLTLLHIAAIADAAQAVVVLIEAGADLDASSISGRRAIDHAAAAGSVEALRALAEAGVDLDAPSGAFVQLPGYPTDAGPTPLATAARAGHADAVAVLLELGASVDAPSRRGQTPLLQAVASGQEVDLISLLLDAGADVDARSSCFSVCARPDTDVVGWARRLNSPEVVELLAQHRTGTA